MSFYIGRLAIPMDAEHIPRDGRRRPRPVAKIGLDGPLPADQIPFHQVRSIGADTVTKLFRLYSGSVAPHFSADMAHVYVSVWHGHMSGELMSANKISLFTGQPRTSVLHRLMHLEENDYVRRIGYKYYIPEHRLKLVRMHHIMRETIKIIKDAARRLSKLDTDSV
jgi:hypothetical protein